MPDRRLLPVDDPAPSPGAGDRRPDHRPAADLRRIGIHPDFWYPVAESRSAPKRGTCAAAFAGDGQVQRELVATHLAAHERFPRGLKALMAKRFGTAEVARTG